MPLVNVEKLYRSISRKPIISQNTCFSFRFEDRFTSYTFKYLSTHNIYMTLSIYYRISDNLIVFLKLLKPNGVYVSGNLYL